jgi:hypothetical protein
VVEHLRDVLKGARTWGGVVIKGSLKGVQENKDNTHTIHNIQHRTNTSLKAHNTSLQYVPFWLHGVVGADPRPDNLSTSFQPNLNLFQLNTEA